MYKNLAGAGSKPILHNKKTIQHYLKKLYKKGIDSGRWDFVNEMQMIKPSYVKALQGVLRTGNAEWDNQIQKMKTFIAEDYHRYFVTFKYLGVTGAKVHTDVEVKSIKFNSQTNEFIIDTCEMGIITLIELEICWFKDCYSAPESPEVLANNCYF